MIIRISAIIFIWGSFGDTLPVDYCKLCPSGSHTMCKYKEGPADCCLEYTTAIKNETVKRTIVHLHNLLRNKVAIGNETAGNPGPQPQAANMYILQWDDELADIAQRWADQCLRTELTEQHDECKKTERFDVGQNVISTLDSKPRNDPRFDLMISAWYKHVNEFDKDNIPKFSGKNRMFNFDGLYTQVVWGETKYVGCGHSSFLENVTVNPGYQIMEVHRFVCNYGPAGNVIGSPVYEIGPPCSRCDVCSTEYPGLCTLEVTTTPITTLSSNQTDLGNSSSKSCQTTTTPCRTTTTCHTTTLAPCETTTHPCETTTNPCETTTHHCETTTHHCDHDVNNTVLPERQIMNNTDDECYCLVKIDSASRASQKMLPSITVSIISIIFLFI